MRAVCSGTRGRGCCSWSDMAKPPEITPPTPLSPFRLPHSPTVSGPKWDSSDPIPVEAEVRLPVTLDEPMAGWLVLHLLGAWCRPRECASRPPSTRHREIAPLLHKRHPGATHEMGWRDLTV